MFITPRFSLKTSSAPSPTAVLSPSAAAQRTSRSKPINCYDRSTFVSFICYLCLELFLVNLSHAVKSVDLLHRLVGADAHDSRKAQRKSAAVSAGTSHVVESHFQHYLRL